jgi:hypothetical protein
MTTPHLEDAAGRDRAHITPDQACCRSANKATDPVDAPPRRHGYTHVFPARNIHFQRVIFKIFRALPRTVKETGERVILMLGGGGAVLFGYLKKSSSCQALFPPEPTLLRVGQTLPSPSPCVNCVYTLIYTVVCRPTR